MLDNSGSAPKRYIRSFWRAALHVSLQTESFAEPKAIAAQSVKSAEAKEPSAFCLLERNSSAAGVSNARPCRYAPPPKEDEPEPALLAELVSTPILNCTGTPTVELSVQSVSWNERRSSEASVISLSPTIASTPFWEKLQNCVAPGVVPLRLCKKSPNEKFSSV